MRLQLSGTSIGSTFGGTVSTLPVLNGSQSPSLSITSTLPSNLSVLTSTPSTLLVTFDRAVDDFSLGNDDFELLHLASDGTTSPLQPGEAQVEEALDPTDPTNHRIVLTLSKALVQGSYQLILSPTTQLDGVDGTTVANTSTGLVLSDFTISPPQGGLSSAVDLQTLGSQETVVPGVLNLAKDPGAVQYYKFEVAPGHHWLVGLEIASHRDGGTLNSSLSLFDSQGNLISTANEGLSSDPSDPYLFQGLDPGTYYVGISAQKNVPDASGVYDPSGTAVGSATSGGAYQLHLVADPDDQATKLLGLRVDEADPLTTTPTGLTLQFSGGLSMASVEDSSHPPLTLVDQAGTHWSLTPIHYDATDGQLALAFDQALPAGTYTLELAGENSLVDLAGLAPITPGLPPGVLGTFVVAPSSPVAGDLGPILPGFAATGIVSKLEVGSGTATADQFVVVTPGIYVIEGITPSSVVGFTIQDGSGKVLATGPGTSSTGEVDVFLAAGAYKIVLTSNSSATEVSLTIREKQTQLSSLLEGGVGQGPALSLRLVTPQANFGQPVGSSPVTPVSPVSTTPPSTTNSPVSTTPPTTGVMPGSPSSNTPTSQGNSSPEHSGSSTTTPSVGVVTPVGPSVAGLLYGNGPVGRASSQSGPIGVVGSLGSTALASVASNSDSLPAGLIAVPVSIDGGGTVVAPASPADNIAQGERPATGRADVTLEAGLLARAPQSRLEDDKTLADADWIGQFVENSMDWFGRFTAPKETQVAEQAVTVPDPASPTVTEEVEESRVESASLTSPFAIGVGLGAIAYGLRRKFLDRKTVLLRKPVPRAHFRAARVGAQGRKAGARIRVD